LAKSQTQPLVVGATPQQLRTSLLETVLLLAELESHLAAFHNLLDRPTNGGHVDRSRVADFAEGLISSGSVVAPHDLFGVSVDYQVGVMACKDELPLFLCGPNLVHDLKDDGVVQVSTPAGQ